jgi:hypothetical protein
MDALSSIEAIIRDLLIFVVAMTALLIALLIIVSRMPDDNPLKRILVALSYRVGATAAAGLIAAPAMPIPGLDAVVDIGAPLLILWYWWTFFRGLRTNSVPAAPAPKPRSVERLVNRD